MRKKSLLLLGILLFAVCMGGCSDLKDSWNKDREPKDQLIKVEITFTDDEVLVGYVKNLGIEKGGTVYVGGSSLNYLYDRSGNIVGSFNYQRVLYMKIITDAKPD